MIWQTRCHVIKPYHWHLNVTLSPSSPSSFLFPLLPFLQRKPPPLSSIATIAPSNPFFPLSNRKQPTPHHQQKTPKIPYNHLHKISFYAPILPSYHCILSQTCLISSLYLVIQCAICYRILTYFMDLNWCSSKGLGGLPCLY